MKFATTSAALKSALSPLLCVYQPKHTMPQLGLGVARLVDDQGELGTMASLACTDLYTQVEVIFRVPSTFQDGDAATFDVRNLSSVLAKVKGDLDVQGNGDELAVVNGVRYPLKASHKPADMPTFRPVDGGVDQFGLPGADFVQAFERVDVAVSKDETRQHLCQVHIARLPDDGRVAMMATDGHRFHLAILAAAVVNPAVETVGLMVPVPAMRAAGRLVRAWKGSTVQVARRGEDETVITVTSPDGNRGIVSTTSTTRFPPWERLVNWDLPLNHECDCAALADALKSCGLATLLHEKEQNDKVQTNNGVLLVFGEDQITVKSQADKVVIVVPADGGEDENDEGIAKPHQMGFNAVYLRQALEAAGAGTVYVTHGDELDPVYVQDKPAAGQGGLFLGLVMPLRL